MTSQNLTGKVVLTTGASSGIGAAIAIEAAARGATSILVSRNAEKLNRIEAHILAHHGLTKSYVTDVTLSANCEQLRISVEELFGPPDIVINNAGAGRFSYVEETPYEEINEMIDAPFRAAAYVTRAFLPAMITRGTGAIGNVTSIAAYLPWPGATVYVAQRWAMRGFHEGLRADFKGTNLSATLLAPSTVDTEYFVKNKTRRPTMPAIAPTLQAKDVAREFFDAIAARKSVLVLPFGTEFLRRLSFVMPKSVAEGMKKACGTPRTRSESRSTLLLKH